MPETHGPGEGHSLCVLIVDDEPYVRQMAERMLTRRGYRTLAAESGETAVALCNAAEPPVEVVLLDLSMPGMSGPETLAALRGGHPDLPVILCSGYEVDCDSFAEEHGHRPQAVLQKPFRMDVLADLIDAVAGNGGRG